jgi:hypothetical protein
VHRQLICFAKTESCVSNDQVVCFTVMNIPCKQSDLEGCMVQIQIAFYVLCIAVMQDLQYMTLRRADVRAQLVWTCWSAFISMSVASQFEHSAPLAEPSVFAVRRDVLFKMMKSLNNGKGYEAAPPC